MFDWSVLDEAIATPAGCDVADLCEDDLFDAVTTIERVRRALDSFEGECLAELDALGACDAVHGLRTVSWLARDAGLSTRTAGTRVRAAMVLRTELPATREALADGVISFDHAKVLAAAVNDRIAEQFRVLEPELIEMTTGMVFARWKAHVQAVAHLLDQDGGYDPNDDIDNNKLSLRPGPDGTIVRGTLVGDAALGVEQAVEQIADELFRQYSEDSRQTDGEVEVPARITLRALALAEICRRALHVDLDTATAPRVEATLVIGAEDLDDVYDPTGIRLQSGSIMRLLCDMSVFPVVVNGLGVPLDMGREIRTANRVQRRALARRDGGCVFPGCGAMPRRCDAHHVRHWHRDLGTTDVKYLVLLCRHHHGVVHRAGWSMTIGDDGWAWITTARGQTLWGQHHGTQRAGPAPP